VWRPLVRRPFPVGENQKKKLLQIYKRMVREIFLQVLEACVADQRRDPAEDVPSQRWRGLPADIAATVERIRWQPPCEIWYVPYFVKMRTCPEVWMRQQEKMLSAAHLTVPDLLL
jgi:hypothetical protein